MTEHDYDSMYGFLLEELKKGTPDNVADRMVKVAYNLDNSQVSELRTEFKHKYGDDIQRIGSEKETETRRATETKEKRKNSSKRKQKILVISIASLIVLAYLSLPLFVSATKYQPLTKNLPLLIKPNKLIPEAVNQAVYEVTKPTPGPCLLFTEEVCKEANMIANPSGTAVAFRLPSSGATIFAPTTGKFWTLKDGSIFLSANNSNGSPLPTATFVGSNGNSYWFSLLGKWNFVLAPPEQGNHTYKQGEIVGTVTPTNGYIVSKDLPQGYNFIVTGKSSSYMGSFLSK